jgi:hypothetical protein
MNLNNAIDINRPAFLAGKAFDFILGRPEDDCKTEGDRRHWLAGRAHLEHERAPNGFDFNAAVRPLLCMAEAWEINNAEESGTDYATRRIAEFGIPSAGLEIDLKRAVWLDNAWGEMMMNPIFNAPD